MSHWFSAQPELNMPESVLPSHLYEVKNTIYFFLLTKLGKKTEKFIPLLAAKTEGLLEAIWSSFYFLKL